MPCRRPPHKMRHACHTPYQVCVQALTALLPSEAMMCERVVAATRGLGEVALLETVVFPSCIRKRVCVIFRGGYRPGRPISATIPGRIRDSVWRSRYGP